MPYIEANIPPQKVLVRDGFLYDDPDGDEHAGKYTSAVLVSVRCLEGSAALFQVLCENGRMRDKLPVSAFCWKRPEDELVWAKHPFHVLQLWDCFSKTFSIVSLNYVFNANVSVRLKGGGTIGGSYLWSINWGANSLDGCDLTLAEDPSEHKSHHFIQLDNGLFALQPNNRIVRWHEPSFVTREPREDERWKINTHEWCCEQHEKWQTEDDSSYMYGTNYRADDETDGQAKDM